MCAFGYNGFVTAAAVGQNRGFVLVLVLDYLPGVINNPAPSYSNKY
jgi:hypothetical protein